MAGPHADGRPDGSLDAHRATTAFRDDAAREEVGRTETTAALIHLRRPSRFSWLGMADTQPFLEGAGRFAFAHNGELADFLRFRDAYRAAGRIFGIGALLLRQVVEPRERAA